MRIAERDGEFCRKCEKLPSEGQLIIDHIDNNNDNNSFDNYQLLCRSCNYKKNPSRPLDQCVSESEKNKVNPINVLTKSIKDLHIFFSQKISKFCVQT